MWELLTQGCNLSGCNFGVKENESSKEMYGDQSVITPRFSFILNKFSRKSSIPITCFFKEAPGFSTILDPVEACWERVSGTRGSTQLFLKLKVFTLQMKQNSV